MTSSATNPLADHRRPTRVLVVVPAFNAGDTTRGIEIARAIRTVADQRGHTTDIEFIYPFTTQSFDAQIRAAGFAAEGIDLGLTDAEVAAIMRADHDGTEFITDPERATDIIEALVTQLRHRRPDLVVYGFLPPAGIAAQIVGIPSVTYVPFPVYRPWVQRHFLRDVPDEIALPGLAKAPQRPRRRIARALSGLVVLTGFFRQPTLAAAGRDLGWRTRRPQLFGMLDADVQLVNDLPGNYGDQEVGPRTRLAGPLFSRSGDQSVPTPIAEHFAAGPTPRVFVSMGSSGESPYLLAAIEAVSAIPCRAVVVVPPHVCSLDEARAHLHGVGDVLLTDAFVPAPAVNALADVAIIHGGQGTVQTAAQAATPVLGVGMQWEQCANIDRLVERGSAIRIPRRQWEAVAVEAALRDLVDTPSYAESAAAVATEMAQTDGYQITGDLVWDLLETQAPNVTHNCVS